MHLKGNAHPKVEIESLSPHPNADGNSGEVSWSFIIEELQ